MNFTEMEPTVTIIDQLAAEGSPVILFNTLVVPSEDAEQLLAAWTRDAEVMKRQPGFISAQIHRGIAGSGVSLNVAVWETPAHSGVAFANPAFREKLADYPPSARVTPHLFRKIAVPGLCAA